MRGRAYTLRIAQWYVTQSEVDLLRGPLVVPEHRVAQDQDAGENFEVSNYNFRFRFQNAEEKCFAFSSCFSIFFCGMTRAHTIVVRVRSLQHAVASCRATYECS